MRCQRAALAIALPVVPAAGLRAAVLGSVAGGSGLGAAVGAGGATSAAGGLAGLGVNGVAAKVLLVTALVGGAGVARDATVDHPHQRRPVVTAPGPRLTPHVATARLTTVARDTAASPAPVDRADATAPAEHAATKVEAKARPDHVRAARGDSAVAAPSGHAAAPGQLKAPGTPAQGKALGKTKAREPNLAGAIKVKVKPDRPIAAPTPSKTKAVNDAPAKPPTGSNASKAPDATEAPAPAAVAPGQGAALAPGQAKKQDETPKKP